MDKLLIKLYELLNEDQTIYIKKPKHPGNIIEITLSQSYKDKTLYKVFMVSMTELKLYNCSNSIDHEINFLFKSMEASIKKYDTKST